MGMGTNEYLTTFRTRNSCKQAHDGVIQASTRAAHAYVLACMETCDTIAHVLACMETSDELPTQWRHHSTAVEGSSGLVHAGPHKPH